MLIGRSRPAAPQRQRSYTRPPSDGGSRRAAPSLCVLAILVSLCGCPAGHYGAGPMIGYSPARGATWGWEAGAGVIGVARVNTGGSYAFGKPELRPAPDEPARIVGEGDEAEASPPETVHYLAFEPLGLTLGADWASNGRSGFLFGLWAGWFVDPTPYGAFNDSPTGTSVDRFELAFDCPDYDPEPTPLISGALGVRYLGGEWEAYFTPKLVAFYCLEFAN